MIIVLSLNFSSFFVHEFLQITTYTCLFSICHSKHCIFVMHLSCLILFIHESVNLLICYILLFTLFISVIHTRCSCLYIICFILSSISFYFLYLYVLFFSRKKLSNITFEMYQGCLAMMETHFRP